MWIVLRTYSSTPLSWPFSVQSCFSFSTLNNLITDMLFHCFAYSSLCKKWWPPLASPPWLGSCAQGDVSTQTREQTQARGCFWWGRWGVRDSKYECEQIVQSRKLLEVATLEAKSAEKDFQWKKTHIDISVCAASQHEVKFHSRLMAFQTGSTAPLAPSWAWFTHCFSVGTSNLLRFSLHSFMQRLASRNLN